MASTTAMLTGLSGLSANARRLEVIGNNIANANTTAFKSNRMLFAPTFNRSFSLGTGPSTATGGTNPGQVGLGVTIAGTQRNFTNGAPSVTGVATDMALEGDGFFVVERAGSQYYTRAGAFQRNAQNDLVTISGERLQGYGIDEDFNIVTGRLQTVNIPLGTLTIAEATRNVNFSGNLNADGVVGSQGSIHTFDQLLEGGVAATSTTLLTALDGAGINVGDTINISGASRGDKVLPDATLTVSAGMDVNGFMGFLADALGVVDNGGFVSTEPTGSQPGGVSIAGGVITLEGNIGTLSDIDLQSTFISIEDSTGTSEGSPFSVAKTQDANGESVRTSFVVYDSLGAEVEVDVTMALALADNNGTYWRAFLHSADDTDTALHLEAGARNGSFTTAAPLLQFDNNGVLASSSSVAIELDRFNTGATDPLSVNLSFASDGANGIGGQVTALANSGGHSSLAAVYQDGSPIGTLSSFSVGDDGVITGGFTNGLTRSIGQIAVASFTNQEGLVDIGNNLFRVGPNSGTPLITTPLNFGTGRIVGGALELSNVDLSAEFINMILTSTGYSASSRVITTADQLIQQLLTVGR